MIPLLLWQLRWRLLALAGAAFLFYLAEPGLHTHDLDPTDVGGLLAPTGIAFSAANLAGLSMIVLLAGFISAHRRRGYYRLQFSHPTRPEAFYALRWAVALVLSVAVSAAFFYLGQLAAWGELRVGGQFLLQAALLAVMYGGLMAFLSAVLPAGDAPAGAALYFVTAFWLEVTVDWGISLAGGALSQAIAFLLPPHSAATDVYSGLLMGTVAWPAVLFCLGYGLFWMIAAGLLVRLREWP